MRLRVARKLYFRGIRTARGAQVRWLTYHRVCRRMTTYFDHAPVTMCIVCGWYRSRHELPELCPECGGGP